MGKCGYCGQPAVVKVNDQKVCEQHIDDAMDTAFAPLQLARKELGL